MKKWEYFKIWDPDLEELDKLGEDGWELVCVRTTKECSDYAACAYFKREKLQTSAVGDYRSKVSTLMEASRRTLNALDDIMDKSEDVAEPLDLKACREAARKVFYPLAKALDEIEKEDD